MGTRTPTSPAGTEPPARRAAPSRQHQHLAFEAYIPETGHWIASDRDRSKVTLYASHEAGAALTAATPTLIDRVLSVQIIGQ